MTPCTEGHDPCEGNALHIRARCATGCPQFQDGSWYARDFCIWRGTPHPGLPRRSGTAGDVEAWLDSAFEHTEVAP